MTGSQAVHVCYSLGVSSGLCLNCSRRLGAHREVTPQPEFPQSFDTGASVGKSNRCHGASWSISSVWDPLLGEYRN
jgi:hypothetical protein